MQNTRQKSHCVHTLLRGSQGLAVPEQSDSRVFAPVLFLFCSLHKESFQRHSLSIIWQQTRIHSIQLFRATQILREALPDTILQSLLPSVMVLLCPESFTCMAEWLENTGTTPFKFIFYFQKRTCVRRAPCLYAVLT